MAYERMLKDLTIPFKSGDIGSQLADLCLLSSSLVQDICETDLRSTLSTPSSLTSSLTAIPALLPLPHLTQSDNDKKYILRGLFTNKEVKLILGTKGQTIAKISWLTNTKLNVSPYKAKCDDRVVSCFGTTEQLAKLYYLIAKLFMGVSDLDKLDLSYDSAYDREKVYVRILLGSELVGIIMGFKGINIDKIEAGTDSKINVCKEKLANSTERVVEIYGNLISIYSATSQIVDSVKDQESRNLKTICYAPGTNPNSNFIKKYGRMNKLANDVNSSNEIQIKKGSEGCWENDIEKLLVDLKIRNQPCGLQPRDVINNGDFFLHYPVPEKYLNILLKHKEFVKFRAKDGSKVEVLVNYMKGEADYIDIVFLGKVDDCFGAHVIMKKKLESLTN